MLRCAVAAMLALGLTACHRPGIRSAQPQPQPQPAPPIDVLWHAPEPNRDLFAGVGGLQQTPVQHSLYTVLGARPSAATDVLEVADPRQRHWSVQLLRDAQADVTVSRLLWGIGYHQLPTYLVRGWRADRGPSRNPQPAAEFRPQPVVIEGQTLKEDGPWSLGRNPFVGSRELAGLVVLQAMLGSADLQEGENSVYALDAPLEGARAWYVPKPFGASFDKTTFITGVQGNVVVFDVPAAHPPLLDRITPADLHWLCDRLNGLTDRQWRDAFRAGGYTPAAAARIIRRVKAKVAAGLALPA
jgi:hypothetical protein